jgi:hypothetical protein
MTDRFLLLLCAFALSGCNCFVPVEECVGIRCSRFPDGGLRDGGRSDGGLVDAGRKDGGFEADGGGGSCGAWDGGGVGKCAAITGYVQQGTVCRGECVLYPIATPGVYPTLGACVACGCDTAKLSTKPTQSFGPTSSCDEVVVTTTLPRLLEEAFPGYDGGCVPKGALDYECTLLTKTSALGDAGYARSCAATLVPYVADVQCRVFIQ